MKPDREGIWEWFEEDRTKRLVGVCNVAAELGEVYLRVYWWGGYYDVHDHVDNVYRCDGTVAQRDVKYEAEWPDRWGNYVGQQKDFKDEDLYLMPTTEQRTEIMKQYEQSKLATDTRS